MVYDKVSLMQLWFENHYEEKAAHIGHPLNSLQRFRIRLKYPPPSNLKCKLMHLRFSTSSRSILNKFSNEVSHYPSPKQKTELAMECDLSIIQISTWFANYRRRLKASHENQIKLEKEMNPNRKRKAENNSHSISQKKRALEEVCLRANAIIRTAIPPLASESIKYTSNKKNRECSITQWNSQGSQDENNYWSTSQYSSPENYYQPPEYMLPSITGSNDYYDVSKIHNCKCNLQETQWQSSSNDNIEHSYFEKNLIYTSEAERNALEALLSLKTESKLL